ncbi:MAG: 4Fe-4S dicluster domain-containing protein [Desulfobulbaceae bacterium]|uniref:4Fe-4S dicluster domain-containing protein n=1 Tax=Candidatus Desulfatifera sulfidica TaxID=2841691 RepID=A0A8J6NAL7_9BACT|nr:4Fe-4S dicluster domain-containing protein [Candidatus Desulfatifera sulfidica]
MTQYAMIIDLRKCVGCGACALACKTENNTALRSNGQTHNWADFIHETTGKFPKTGYKTTPVLCNHCSNAPCVDACPVEPKAMFKTKDGITMHNDERCIGCRACQEACPYSMDEVKRDGAYGEYSVISYNEEGEPYQALFSDSKELIPGCTTSGTHIARAAGATPPHLTRYGHPEYDDTRRSGIVEKCYFCDHRVKKGDQPYCVESCPAGARIFGNIRDSGSTVAKLLKKHKPSVLKPEAGTQPNVLYIGEYGT